MTAATVGYGDMPPELLDPATPARWSARLHSHEVFARDDVIRVLTDPDGEFTQKYGDPQANLGNAFPWAMDGNEHRQLRGLIVDPFRTHNVRERLGPVIEWAATELAEQCAGDGRLDLATYALRLPNWVISALLGVDPVENEERAEKWLRASAKAATTAGEQPYREEVTEWIGALLADRLATPRDDLATHVARLHDSGKIDIWHAMGLVWGLWTAGSDTTGAGIAAAVLCLLEQDLLHVVGHLRSLDPLVHELLRLRPSFPAVRVMAVRDVAFGDYRVPAGDPVTAWISAANRDPDVFPQPHELLLDRDPKLPLTFARGSRHHCLGEPLAVMEVTAALRVLTSPRFAGMRLDPAVPVQWQLGIVHSVGKAELSFGSRSLQAAS